MTYNVRITNKTMQIDLNIGQKWLDDNIKDRWKVQYSIGGATFIAFDNNDDRCLFILKFGEFVEYSI